MKKYVAIDGYLKIDPTKEEIRHAQAKGREVIFIRKSFGNIVIESYWINKDLKISIDFAYDLDSGEDYINIERELFFDSLEQKPTEMRAVAIPERFFEGDGIRDLLKFIR